MKDKRSDFKIGERMRLLRGKLSQSEAGRCAGIKQQLWAQYELGQNLPGVKAIDRICSAFHVTPNWLFGIDELPDVDIRARAAMAEAQVVELKAQLEKARALAKKVDAPGGKLRKAVRPRGGLYFKKSRTPPPSARKTSVKKV